MSSVANGLEDGRIPELTIRSVARGFFREADRYGFTQADYLRFMSSLLDFANDSRARGATTPDDALVGPVGARAEPPVRIRNFDRASDYPLLLGWVEEEAGRDFLLARNMARPITLAELVDDSANILGVVTLPDGTPLGATAFIDHDPVQRKAELRKLIGDARLRGRGYGMAATRLWLRYGFEELHLHKVYLSTLDTNLRNIRLNERLGFRVEGILHDEMLVDGCYHDVLRMAIRESHDAG